MKEIGATDRSLLLSMHASPIDAGRKGEPRNRNLRRQPVLPSFGKLPSSLLDGLARGKRRNTRKDRPERGKESSWGVAIRPVSSESRLPDTDGKKRPSTLRRTVQTTTTMTTRRR